MRKILIISIIIAAAISGFYFFENRPRNPAAAPKKDMILVKTFFSNTKFDPGLMDCSKVYPITRDVPKTQAVARASLEELLKGPTEEEKSQGYLTSINKGAKIQSLRIDNGIAYADFDEQLEFQVGGSCRVQAIASQIRQTLLQFPTVREVIISIDGRTEDILQP